MTQILYVTGWNHILNMFFIDRYSGNRKTNRVLYNTERQMLSRFRKLRNTITQESQL